MASIKVLPVPSLCRVQLVKSASDVYPQVLVSKLQEPGNSWLWAWMVALSTEKEKGEEKNEREGMVRMNHSNWH